MAELCSHAQWQGCTKPVGRSKSAEDAEDTEKAMGFLHDLCVNLRSLRMIFLSVPAVVTVGRSPCGTGPGTPECTRDDRP